MKCLDDETDGLAHPSFAFRRRPSQNELSWSQHALRYVGYVVRATEQQLRNPFRQRGYDRGAFLDLMVLS